MGKQKMQIKSKSPLLNIYIFQTMQGKVQSPKITVAIRKRPLNKKQLQKSETDIIRIEDHGSVIVSELKQKVDLTKYIQQTTFNFDFAFNENSDNQQIYDSCIQPLIDSAFMGAKVSCFAYGQTGSGKTYTMKGDIEKGVPGLYYLGARQIFRYLDHPNFQNLQVFVSFFEIYCGKLYDLLNNRTELKIMEDKKSNINVIGMEEKYICSAEEFLDLIQYGSNFRVTSQNATNADSSRSHAILQIVIKDGKKPFTKISFIDLAGNQRGADHMDQNKQTKIDGAQINKSLLALKECIRALDQGKGHTPFRGSKLTMVLKDSFVGFCKTVMIGNVSPNVSSAENTMNTLRYADRVKELKNSSQNTPLSRQQQAARQMMLPRANKNSIKVNINRGDDEEEIEAKKEMARRNMKKNGNKNEINSDMDIEQPQRRKTDTYVLQRDQRETVKNEVNRKSINPTPNKLPGEIHNPSQLQDQNNPRQRHFNFPMNKQTKHIDMKPQTKVATIELQDNHFVRNRPQGLPRTQQINSQYSYQNPQKLQHDYGKLMQEVHHMKQEFYNDYFSTIKQEGVLIREEGEYLRNQDIDVHAVQSKINRKIQILMELKKKADRLAGKINQSESMSRMVGQSHSYDEQLLQGLPVDDFGGKLF